MCQEAFLFAYIDSTKKAGFIRVEYLLFVIQFSKQ